eukprot:gene9046-1143_t
MSKRKRMKVLQNQIYPSIKTESTKYFSMVNRENIISSRQIETVKIREVLSNITNLFNEIYFLLEKEDDVVEKGDWWDQMKKMVGTPNSAPNEEKLKYEIIEELEEFPIIPSFTIFFFKAFDIFLNLIKGINLISLVLVMKTHSFFQRVKPMLIQFSVKLQTKIQQVDLNVKESIEKRTTKFLMNLRKKRPAQYYQIMSLYLKMKNVITKPKDVLRRLFWLISYSYLKIFQIPTYLLEKMNPNLTRILEKSWSDFYKYCTKILEFWRKTEVFKELN